MPKGIPLTDEEQSRKRHEIFAATVHLFLEKGFTETSMREIAEAAGMGKSSLYDYFKTKDEILIWYFEDEIEDMTLMAREIANQPLPAVEKLRQILRKQLELLLENKEFYLKLSVEIQRLGAESQRRIQIKRHEYQDLLRSLIEQGIQEGAFRQVDTLLATRILITALTPVVFTSRPTGTPTEMLDEAFSLFLHGVQA
jgi:TetR/AcrR family transcriptional regulator, cholesterol catabolism regulator